MTNDRVEKTAELIDPQVGKLSLERSRMPPRVKATTEAGVLKMEITADQADTFQSEMNKVFGTQQPGFADGLLLQLLNADKAFRGDPEGALNRRLTFMAGIAPANETEAMLAAQMNMVHDASMDLATRAAHTTDRQQFVEYSNLMIKMNRTFVAQIEALAKLRTGGKQTVEVVYVDARGGQNIIASTVGRANDGRGSDHK